MIRMSKTIVAIKYRLPNADLTVHIEYMENMTVLDYEYLNDYAEVEYYNDTINDIVLVGTEEFNKIVDKKIKTLNSRNQYTFYDGTIEGHYYYDTFEDLVNARKVDIFDWVEDRQNNLELDKFDSVRAMSDTLKVYSQFLDDIKDLKNEQKVARAIEGMYNWLDDSFEWKVYYNDIDLANY